MPRTIREIRQCVAAIGGSLDYYGRSREFPPSGRPYWRRLYKLYMPGALPEIVDKLSLQARFLDT